MRLLRKTVSGMMLASLLFTTTVALAFDIEVHYAADHFWRIFNNH